MGDFLKTAGYVLLAVLGLSVATGVGIVLTALSSILGTTLLGAAVVIFVAACIKEYFGTRSKRDR